MRKLRIALLLGLAPACILLAGCGGGSEPAKPAVPGPDGAKPAATAPAKPAGPQGPMGSATVRGVVRYEGQVPPMKAIKMDADPGCAKKHTSAPESEMLVLGDGNTMANVLVRVSAGIDGSYSPPSEPVVLDQEGCRYSPHVMGMMAGQPLKILNSDGLLHNVHALPKTNKPFNKAMPGSVTEADAVFEKVEAPFKIKCDVHPWMGAWVGVHGHPFYAVTGSDGSFSLARLPAGDYQIEAWHEKLGTLTESVTIADGATAEVGFTFKR